MRFTSDYRRVRALFDTPLEREVDFDRDFAGNRITWFDVGPFIYTVVFEPDNPPSQAVMRVEFRLSDIRVTGDELIRMMSKVKQEFAGKRTSSGAVEEPEMSLEEAEKIKDNILTYHSYSELEITGPYALKVFGAVLQIVKTYVQQHPVGCLVFSADPEARARIYQRMMKSAFPRASIRAYPSPWGAGTEIKVCFA
jgi:hypothetical protein